MKPLILQPSSPSHNGWVPEAFPPLRSLLSGVAVIVIMLGTVLLAVTGIFFLRSVSHGTLFKIDPGTPQGISIPTLMLVQTIAYIPTSFFLFWALPKLARRSLYELGFRRPKKHDLLIALAGTLAALALTDAAGFITELLVKHPVSQKELALFYDLHGFDAFFAALTATVFAPFVEELVFRIFVLNALNRYLAAPLALVLSGLLFGIAHGDMGAVFPLTVCGIVLGIVYQRTHCAWSNIISHGLFNSIGMISIFVFHIKAT